MATLRRGKSDGQAASPFGFDPFRRDRPELDGAGGRGPVGRRLDFLAQEFNRETNTICSKSNAASVTALGLEMKLVIDQFREQVQNLE